MYLIIGRDNSIYKLKSLTQAEMDASMCGYITIVNMNTQKVLNYDGGWDDIEVMPYLEGY